MISFNDYLTWAYTFEPKLKPIDSPETKDSVVGDDITSPQLLLYYDLAVAEMKRLEYYMSEAIYRNTVYSLALHYAIIYNPITIDSADNLATKPQNLTPLQSLYIKYRVDTYGDGILNMWNTSTSSGSSLTPRQLGNGDTESAALLATPYGKKVEIVFENLTGIIISV